MKYTVLNISYGELSKLLYPYFLGAFIRGNFGRILRKISCPFRGKKNCISCIINKKCFYFNVFESIKDGKKPLPHPFIIEVEYFGEKEVRDFSFNFILIGDSVEHFEYIILTFYELWRIGFGKKGIKSKNFSVKSFGKLIFSSDMGEKIYRQPEIKEFKFEGKGFFGKLSLKLLSPLRLMKEKRVIKRLSFEDVIRASLRRFIMVSENYLKGFKRPEKGWIDGLIESSKNIKVLNDKTSWVEYSRYSTRKRERLKFGGLKGEIEFEGKFTDEHIGLLRFSQIFHLGSLTTFGYGKIDFTESFNNGNGGLHS